MDQIVAAVASMSLAELNYLLNSQLWKFVPGLPGLIFDRFSQLCDGTTHFGNDDFWQALGLFDETESDESRETIASIGFSQEVQQGGTNFFAPNSSVETTEPKIINRKHYTVTERFRQNVKKFQTEGSAFKVRFHDLNSVPDVIPVVHDGLQELLDSAFKDAADTDKVGLEIRHQNLNRPILVPFLNRRDFNVEHVIRTLERVEQSNEDFTLDDEAEFQFTRISVPPVGSRIDAPFGAAKHSFKGNFSQWFEKRCGHGGCFVSIKNTSDELCLARSLVTARARLHKDESPESLRAYNNIRKGDSGRRTAQRRLAEQLMADAMLQEHKGPTGPTELLKLQDALPGYQIKVWSKQACFSKVFEGPPAEKVLHIFHYNNHFATICSMAAFFDRSYWCESCERPYDRRDSHLCSNVCECCLNRPVCPLVDWIHCSQCNRNFRSNACFDRHLAHEVGEGAKRRRVVPICKRLTRCSECGKTENTSKGNHRCNGDLVRCNVCGLMITRDFLPSHCFMQKLDKSKETEINNFIFYDFEATQETVHSENALGSIFEHKINCAVTLKLCTTCKDYEPERNCSSCGLNRLRQFFGMDALEQFCAYIFSEDNKGSVCIAHNSGNYDNQFVLRYLHNQGIQPRLLTRGLRILSLEACSIRFVDSFLFLPFALSKFSSAFDLSVQKGTFPHLFNEQKNFSYIGPLPEAYFYQPASMKSAQREKFFEWYFAEKRSMEEQGRLFNFKDELLHYCTQDVLVLAKGCMAFRKMFMDALTVDPFSTVTLASACNRGFRACFLRAQTIALIPHGGYRKKANQSVEAIKYFQWYSRVNNLEGRGQHLRHALNNGEQRIGPFLADAVLYSNDGTDLKVVMEHNGCAWHGCPRCYRDRTTRLPNSLTAEDAFQRTADRRRFFEAQGYRVLESWSCELDSQLKQSPEMRRFFKESTVQTPLNPREGFYGGRCNATVLYHRCSDAEYANYVDVCSLYPYICKYGQFPIDHPRIITDNFKDLNVPGTKPYKGLIKVKVLPPTNLMHPLLPLKINSKLMFVLCYNCASMESQEVCTCTDEERSFWGTWTHLEIYAARLLGYKFLEIAEVWDYQKWTHYKADPTRALFADYINTFLVLKAQSSGWPSDVETEEDKQKYIDEYRKAENIELDPEKVEKNAALRLLAKLALNSFWGKFGQRSGLEQCTYFTEPSEFFAAVSDETNEITGVQIVNEGMVMLSYHKKDDFVESAPNANPVIACYVTSQARLLLYHFISKIDPMDLWYKDTDSLVYLVRAGKQDPIKTGDKLGEMTNELDCYGKGSYITEFCSGGPKQYSAKIWSTDKQKFEFMTKIRGFTIDCSAAKTLNFHSLKKSVLEYIRTNSRNALRVVQNRIEKNSEREVLTKTVQKSYKVCYDKRVVLADGTTEPYGYRV